MKTKIILTLTAVIFAAFLLTDSAISSEASNIIQQLRFEAERKDAEISDLKEQNKLLKEELQRLTKYVNELSERIKRSSSMSPSAQPPASFEKIEEDEKFIYHTVKPGDMLTGLSLKYYKESRFWQKIYEANKDSIGEDKMLRVGQKIKIPK